MDQEVGNKKPRRPVTIGAPCRLPARRWFSVRTDQIKGMGRMGRSCCNMAPSRPRLSAQTPTQIHQFYTVWSSGVSLKGSFCPYMDIIENCQCVLRWESIFRPAISNKVCPVRKSGPAYQKKNGISIPFRAAALRCRRSGFSTTRAGGRCRACSAPRQHCTLIYYPCFTSASASATTFSTLNPKFFKTVPPGAEAPKPFMPITLPAGPT